MTIGCSKEVESDQETCDLRASSVKWGGWVAFEGSIDVNVGRLHCLLGLLPLLLCLLLLGLLPLLLHLLLCLFLCLLLCLLELLSN